MTVPIEAYIKNYASDEFEAESILQEIRGFWQNCFLNPYASLSDKAKRSLKDYEQT